MTLADLERKFALHEARQSISFIPDVPVIARLRGANFAGFTKNMERPYDIAFSKAMVSAATYIANRFEATIAHVHGEEISLMFATIGASEGTCERVKVQDLASDLAASATAEFTLHSLERWPSRTRIIRPSFLCRTWQLVPEDVPLYFLWQVEAAAQNAANIVAPPSILSDLAEISASNLGEVFAKTRVSWEFYPAHFREGTFIQRRVSPGAPTGHAVLVTDLPKGGFPAVTNVHEFLFNSAAPQTTFPLGATLEQAEALRAIVAKAKAASYMSLKKDDD